MQSITCRHGSVPWRLVWTTWFPLILVDKLDTDFQISQEWPTWQKMTQRTTICFRYSWHRRDYRWYLPWSSIWELSSSGRRIAVSLSRSISFHGKFTKHSTLWTILYKHYNMAETARKSLPQPSIRLMWTWNPADHRIITRISHWYRRMVCRLITNEVARKPHCFHSAARSARTTVVAWPWKLGLMLFTGLWQRSTGNGHW